MFGLPNIPRSDVPDALRLAPRIDSCKRCGRPIMWCRRSDDDEIGSPLEPRPSPNGNLVILGFTSTVRTSAIVPHARAVNNVDELPDLRDLPSWAEGQRWLHHAPFCKIRVMHEDAAIRSATIDDDLELSAAFYRRREQSRRQTLISDFMRWAILKLPMWLPSQRLQEAFTDYELGRINAHELKATITYEEGLVGDFSVPDSERYGAGGRRRSSK